MSPNSSDRPYQPAPAFQKLLDKLAMVDGGPVNHLSRDSSGEVALQFEIESKDTLGKIPVASVVDAVIPAINHVLPARLFIPADQQLARHGKLPILLYWHGGGFTFGSLATHESATRALANKIPALVISCNYRLAPTHPYPAAIHDALVALSWVVRNAEDFGGDLTRLAVGGDSAGANLATVVAGKAKRLGIPVAYQALVYPWVDLSRMDTRSYAQYGQGHFLTARAIAACRSFYVPNQADWGRSDVSPLLAADADLAELPPASLLLAGCDPLRDEGQAYGERLQGNRVATQIHTAEALIHGFLSFYNYKKLPAATPLVDPQLDLLAADLRRAFATGGSP